jgi:hypothetical protein
MNMHSREQCLETLRQEYRRASKKQKTKLLNDARKRAPLTAFVSSSGARLPGEWISVYGKGETVSAFDHILAWLNNPFRSPRQLA